MPPAHPEASIPVRTIYEGWTTFGIATVTQPDGTPIGRCVEHHGAATAVLPYDPVRRTALLVRQVRVGVAWWGGDGELDEAPAGGLDGGAPDETARREAMEEAGVALSALEAVGCFYPMPSVSTERIHLFLAPYAANDRVAAGGGLAAEDETGRCQGGDAGRARGRLRRWSPLRHEDDGPSAGAAAAQARAVLTGTSPQRDRSRSRASAVGLPAHRSALTSAHSAQREPPLQNGIEVLGERVPPRRSSLSAPQILAKQAPPCVEVPDDAKGRRWEFEKTVQVRSRTTG